MSCCFAFNYAHNYDWHSSMGVEGECVSERSRERAECEWTRYGSISSLKKKRRMKEKDQTRGSQLLKLARFECFANNYLVQSWRIFRHFAIFVWRLWHTETHHTNFTYILLGSFLCFALCDPHFNRIRLFLTRSRSVGSSNCLMDNSREEKNITELCFVRCAIIFDIIQFRDIHANIRQKTMSGNHFLMNFQAILMWMLANHFYIKSRCDCWSGIEIQIEISKKNR